MYTYDVYRKNKFLFYIDSAVPIQKGDKILLEGRRETKLKVISIKHWSTIVSDEQRVSNPRLDVR
ncbi:MAG: hypothetical protein ACOZAL_00065 [Patescibacteria group bacterium]